MAIIVELPDGQRIQVERDSATIGRGPGADIVVSSMEIEPLHAKIRKLAARWIVESAGDWCLQVGDGIPGRKLWLRPGEVLRLSESGISVVFEPGMREKPTPPFPHLNAAAPVVEAPRVVGWYVFHDNQTNGPYTFEDLQEMASSGMIASTELVAKEGSAWVEARTIDNLVFSSQPSWQENAVPVVEAPSVVGWYVFHDNEPNGPYAFEDLQEMAMSGMIAPTELVAKEGSAWVEARTIDSLVFSSQPACQEMNAAPAAPTSIPQEHVFPSSEIAWYTFQNNEQFGPFTFGQLREMATAGRLFVSDLVAQQGTSWIQAGTVEGLMFSQQGHVTGAAYGPKRTFPAISGEQPQTNPVQDQVVVVEQPVNQSQDSDLVIDESDE